MKCENDDRKGKVVLKGGDKGGEAMIKTSKVILNGR